MKLLNVVGVVGIGIVALSAACSSSSSGSGGGGGSSSGSASSSGSSSGSASSSGSSSGSASSSGSSSGSASSSGSSSGSGGALPTITITTPTSGQSVPVTKTATETDVSTAFTTTNFTLMAPGGCGSVSKTCGHVHLYIDAPADGGTSPCTPQGDPYNNDGFASPINAILSKCTNADPVNGSHTIHLELHADDHSAITDASGATISADVPFTATGG